MYKLPLSTEDPLINIKDHLSRKLEPSEQDKIAQALTSLLSFAHDERKYKGKIECPDEWRIIDVNTYQCGYALGSYGILYNPFTLESACLPAIIAHIIGWYNYPDEIKERQPAYRILTLRNEAASFTYKRLPTPLWERFIKPIKYEHRFRRDKLSTPALPEVLRPKPVDVLIGGGYSYKEFSYSREEEVSILHPDHEYTIPGSRNSDSANGITAVEAYLKALDLFEWENFEEWTKITFMQESFQFRNYEAKRFKKAQTYADSYAFFMFGQGGQLLDLLTRYRQLSTTDTQNTIHFYRPLNVRIEYLTQLLDQYNL